MNSVNLPDNTPEHIPQELVFPYNYHGDKYHGEPGEAYVHSNLQKLQQDAPEIFWTPKNGGHWVVTSYNRIADVVQDYEHFSAKEMQIPRIENPPFFIPLNVDPPNNMPYRQALMPAFSPRAVKVLEEKIRHWAAKFIDDAIAKGDQFDFMAEISSVFPVSVFMELMGMPMDRLREFRELSDAFFSTNDQEKIHALSGQIIMILTEILMAKKENPQDDLMSKILEIKVKGEPISLEEMQNMCFLLFLGGMDTVTNVTGFTFRQMAAMPELQARVHNNPEDIAKCAEEGIRLFGVISNPRIVAQDCEKFGVQFKKDDMVLCLLPIAARDQSVNNNADVFDIDRDKEDANTLTFSKGPHHCLGNFLARTEIRILCEEWYKRVEHFEVPEGTELNFRAGFALAYNELPLKVKAK